LGWGLAGYLTFFVAPALGLPPEIPSMEAAAIGGRQSWWVLAVVGTAAGIASLLFLTGFAKLLAIVFLAAPWLVGGYTNLALTGNSQNKNCAAPATVNKHCLLARRPAYNLWVNTR